VSASETLHDTGRALLPDGRPKVLAPPIYQGKQWIFLLLVVIAGAIVPSIIGGDPYRDGLLDEVMINAILALGFFWCFSLAGQFTFAVFAMYATGSYVSVWAANQFGNFWYGFLIAMLVTAVIGAVTRLVFYRLSPIYFAIATMAVGGLLLILFRQWVSFTGGYDGISVTQIPSFFGQTMSTPHMRYYLMLGVLGVFLAATVAFQRSPAMRDLIMSRDKGPVAATAGLKPAQLGLVAFVVGSAIQGAAGSLYAHNSGYFSLESFSIDISLNVLLMVLLGGLGSIYGPIIGAALLVYIPEMLRDYQQYAEIIYAALVLAIVVLFPGGIADTRRIVGGWVRRARR
jgi:branched-chain amino acid transport system permease protein